MPADLLADAEEQVVLDVARAVLRREHARLVLLQLRRDVALGVLQRLLAHVVGGDFLLVRVRDLDVIAEDLVVADLERGDFRALDLARLEARDPALAVALDRAQLVEFGGIAFADEAAFLQEHRRVGGDGGADERARLVHRVEPLADGAEARVPAPRSGAPSARAAAPASAAAPAGRARSPARWPRAPSAARCRTPRSAAPGSPAAARGP